MTVEADVSDGLPGLILVGYLASEVREGGDSGRRSKISDFPCRQRSRSTCPGQILERKGPDSDLAIAAAILSAYGGFRAKDLKDAVLFGELGLDGTVRGNSWGYGTYRPGTGKWF